MDVYRIKNWEDQFENNRTRKMKNMMWVPVPNKHDGDGYTELIDHENGAAHLGAWLAILQVASKCPIRGTLMRDNGMPHSATTIARVTRIGKGIIYDAITRLSSVEIGWLEVVQHEDVTKERQEGAFEAHPTDEEGKGIEGNRIEEKGTENDPHKSFLNEVAVAMNNKAIEHNCKVKKDQIKIIAESFNSYYKSKGWRIGGSKIVDKIACAEKWILSEISSGNIKAAR